MIQRYGIDTSILVRLATGDPERDFVTTVESLTALVEAGHEVSASNQVIGEAYVALQHHYAITKARARHALGSVLRSGLVEPLGGPPVLACLDIMTGCGLVDRLIVDEYQRAGLTVLTRDQRMSRLPDTRLV